MADDEITPAGQQASGNKAAEIITKHIKIFYGIMLLFGLFLIFESHNTVQEIMGLAIAVVMIILLSIPPISNKFEQEAIVAWNEFVVSPTGEGYMVKPWHEYMPKDTLHTIGGDPLTGQGGQPSFSPEIRSSEFFWLFKIPTRGNDPQVFILRSILKPGHVRFNEYIPPTRASGMADNDFDAILEAKDKIMNKDSPLELKKRFMKTFGMEGRRHRRRNRDIQNSGMMNNMGDME